jgi:hypothetical protein
MAITNTGEVVISGNDTDIATVGGTGTLQVLGTGGGDSLVTIGRFSANAGAPAINFAKSRHGTIGGNTIVQDGDSCGEINWCVSDGSDMISYIAQLEAEVDGTPGSNDTPGRLMFKVTADGAAGPTERMRLIQSGDLHCDGDVIAASTTISDKRLKDNVETIPNALDKVMKLRGIEFDWNKGSRKGQRDLGLIAQEVEKVLPELVREKKMPLIDDKEYLTVDYDKMVAVLVEAIKELTERVKELEGDK